jgi:spore germination cell wall hydrolase CwlJ-like protein
MKLQKFLISLLVLGSTAVVAQEAEVKFSNTMFNQATQFVERTVNMIATPFLSDKDVDCLARNIFYESGGEPTEGKIAVGMVTVNRAQDPRFGRSVCEVVNARTIVVKNREVKKTEMVRVGFFGHPEPLTRTYIVTEQVPVCQFSWVCAGYARRPKPTDDRWIESRAIAEGIARGEYEEYRTKYSNALFFHSAAIRPVWAKTKQMITRTGYHIFYE